MGKKLPEDLAALLTADAVGTRPVRIMCQDEARFGQMVRIRRCRPPAPLRPAVDNGYERQFTYVYGAVSPLQGELDWMISPKMNTDKMNQFLLQVSAAHPEEFIVMIVDGASSHRSQDLRVPGNIRLHRPPAIPRNSILRNMSGMNCAKRNSPTRFSNRWRPSPVNSKRVFLGWPPTPRRHEA